MLYSSNGGGMSGQKNDAAGSVGFFRQSLCDLFFFALVVDIEMGEDALHLWQGRVYVQWLVIGIGNLGINLSGDTSFVPSTIQYVDPAG